MKKYSEMSREELLALKKELDSEFDEIKAEGLALDMSRGKPALDQLESFHENDGSSCRGCRSEM